MEDKAAEDGSCLWHHMETAATTRHVVQRQAVEGPGTSPLLGSYSHLPWPAICCRSHCKHADATNVHCLV